MDRSGLITLIKFARTQDEYGVWRKTESERTILARQVDSVTSQEFFDGGRNGLNPSLRLIVFYADYQGESVVEYLGERYAIYRTYQNKTDNLELYCEREGGVNAQSNN